MVIQTMSWYTAKIDRVTQVLESSQYQDEALATAWRDRMVASSTSGQSSSASLPKAVSPRGGRGRRCGGPHLCRHDARAWRELTRERGWTTEQYTPSTSRG